MERRTRGKTDSTGHSVTPTPSLLRAAALSHALPLPVAPPARAVRSLRRRPPLAPSSFAFAALSCPASRRAIPRSSWGAPRFSSGFRSAGSPNNPAWRPKGTPKLSAQPKPAADDGGPAGEASAQTTTAERAEPAHGRRRARDRSQRAEDGGPDSTEAGTRATPPRAYLSGCVNWAL